MTYVSGKGTDTGTCASPATPCRTFQFALGQTSANGEITALDPANYGPVNITQSISITGVDGAGIIRSIAADAITINARRFDIINLSHLTIDGVGIAQRGIVFNSGGRLTITHCTVRNFVKTGIFLVPTGAAKFLIGDTLVSNNLENGILVVPQLPVPVVGTLDHVLMDKNGNGILVIGAARGRPFEVTAVDSLATNNFNGGFNVIRGADLRLAHSAATGNGAGVDVDQESTAESAGNNDIFGNGTDVAGDLTRVGTR